jgi:hypothetical protein
LCDVKDDAFCFISSFLSLPSLSSFFLRSAHG